MFNALLKKLRIDVNKNSKLSFYLRGLYILYTPKSLYIKDLEKDYSQLDTKKKEAIDKRVSYYNKCSHPFVLPKETKTIFEFIKTEKKKTYFFDLLEYLKYFPYHLQIAYLFGDIREVPEIPTIVKSRPISQENANAVLLKLNKVRHFIFVEDTIPFQEKENLLVWRGKVHQKHRIRFFEKHFNNPLCNIGMVNENHLPKEWKKGKLSLKEQLHYKFILAIEGNDVASNLKWVFSSNSLAVMPKPKYETWFMEGKLEAGVHYVEIKEDFSNLDEQLHYYMQHPQEAQKILENAHQYVAQFQNKKEEDIISFLVLKKYFSLQKS